MLGGLFDFAGIEAELNQLGEMQSDINFYKDSKAAEKVLKREKVLKDKLEVFNRLASEIKSTNELLEISADDNSLLEEVFVEVNQIEAIVIQLDLDSMLKGEYDSNNAYVMLQAGAGGTDSSDWCGMLFRMYSMYAANKGFSLTVLDSNLDSSGYKSIEFLVEGENAYGYLKAEMGVHRLVRLSPFDSANRRHTSFASVEVLPQIDETSTIAIKLEDIRIDTFRSGGAGGQHVNTTDSAVRITHIQTGLVVQCQNERSQIQNKETAMKMLYSKLAALMAEQKAQHISNLKGVQKKIEWGSQIRSYVLHPYNLVKDHRTNFETSNTQAVLDGKIDGFIETFLRSAN